MRERSWTGCSETSTASSVPINFIAASMPCGAASRTRSKHVTILHRGDTILAQQLTILLACCAYDVDAILGRQLNGEEAYVPSSSMDQDGQPKSREPQKGDERLSCR